MFGFIWVYSDKSASWVKYSVAVQHLFGANGILEAGKNGLTRDTLRDATSEEVRNLKQENQQLKTSLAEAILEVQRYKKSLGM